ncbi:hypothetical protein [Parasphingorhabdus halotolerans]|uniref:Uncharacterized protein n=1 Tax=Parasphingorhabdus halotolerans TaxID=2725558 RepID=A0A6H2DKW0_9SPHN|nr:hypothetical protein [Parasphingorhabdus halotolerans]QJB69299.1 hypothetical protein HF685_08410 [Parasphingorhabdus halotolerans]
MDLSRLRIGTLSFQLDDRTMVLSSKVRRKIIRKVAEKHAPDILVCAGFSVDTVKDIRWLHQKSLASYCYVEAANGGKKVDGNQYFLVGGNFKKPLKFGTQKFATQEDFAEGKVSKLENSKNRFHSILDFKAYLMVCGEINVIKGRDKPVFNSDKVKNFVRLADIVINPNHDRMGNPGTLNAKRSLLSKKANDRSKLYINCANWHTNKPSYRAGDQKQYAETLHTIYLDGRRLSQQHISKGKAFEYREIDLSEL